MSVKFESFFNVHQVVLCNESNYKNLFFISNAQTEFLLMPWWAGSRFSVPVICQHVKDANRFPINELTGLGH